MAPEKTTAIKLRPLAREPLKVLRSRLQSEFGVSASELEIVSALVYGATPAQTFGMLLEFQKASARTAEAGDNAPDNGE